MKLTPAQNGGLWPDLWHLGHTYYMELLDVILMLLVSVDSIMIAKVDFLYSMLITFDILFQLSYVKNNNYIEEEFLFIYDDDDF